ncbi:MAG: arginyltransferase [Wolinella sp.]
MQENIIEFIPREKPCSYLGDRHSLFRYFHVQNCSNGLYQILLERGWRRFGRYFFVPICKACRECISVRKAVDSHVLSRSFKRVLAKNRNTALVVQRPMVSEAHLELYDRYHRVMSEKKGWEYTRISAESYFDMFVDGAEEFGYEFAYYIDGQLVCVALVDILGSSISAVYCFYDHTFSDYSLGIYSILKQFELAKSMGIGYFYPGYWIRGHHSMGYKERFAPYEILTNEPDLYEEPIWLPQGEIDEF